MNDGIPEKSCHKFISELALDNLKSYRLGFIIPLSVTVIANCIYTLIFLRRAWKICCKKDKKKEEKDKKSKKGRDIEVETPDAGTDQIELELEQQEPVDSEETKRQRGKSLMGLKKT